MRYLSTRGQTEPMAFKDAVLTGLAPDGGLLLPESIPNFAPRLHELAKASYVELAEAIFRAFADDIDDADLHRLVRDSYATFDVPDVVARRSLGGVHILELFHGPTLAFKDVALQFLGRLFEHVLGERGQRLNILGATSGDTGSAAIAGVRGQDNIDIFVMYPQGRISPLQELQMVTVPDANVHCLAVDGSFDDCQRLMKTLFADLAVKQELALGAVNSVNWARILAQIVYYAHTSLALAETGAPVSFCVPTGNFGNVFAGYLARSMGFPVGELIVATNANDILARFFATGVYQRGTVHQTPSPAMDIQVSSNFERYLYYRFEGDTAALRAAMGTFTQDGTVDLGMLGMGEAFHATAVTNEDTLATMRRVYETHEYVLDPHTAVGVAAAERFQAAGQHAGAMVCLATAHPAKFPAAVGEALEGLATDAAVHGRLTGLEQLPRRSVPLPADLGAVEAYIRTHARAL